MGFICLTNNKMVFDEYKDKYDIRYFDVELKSILIKARDMVHKGHKLLSHPLSGSVKPGETMIKSVFISEKAGKLDTDCVILIENSIAACDKFIKREASHKVRKDFETVDMALSQSVIQAIESAY